MIMIALAWTLAGIVAIVLGVAIFRWTADFRRPQWRRDRWVPRRTIHPWQPWWAWRPVRTVSNRVVWCARVYRVLGNDFVDYDDWSWYHYADDFDLIRHS